jgi:hypothetical protein
MPYTQGMTIEQTVDIPADHRLLIEVPREVPAGRAILTFTPANGASASTAESGEQGNPAAIAAIPEASRGNSADPAFRNAIRSLQGAWKDNPWENCIEDIRAMREEWDHRDPWNSDPAQRHRD